MYCFTRKGNKYDNMGIITKFTVNLEHEIGENSSNCLRYCPHCLPDEYTSWYPQRNVELFSWASLSMSPFAFSGLQTNYFSDTLHTYVLIHQVLEQCTLDLQYTCIIEFINKVEKLPKLDKW